ncbi:MAG TPA: winged helix-turn-helix domain-containing protein [Pyrinomonadaceae bacterium]|nr:winged helix-turn-helix domain-containing protein [Pyrinomonadaceae bacterium]
MSLAESSLTRQAGQDVVQDDVYDDGLLRVEHKNYYASFAGECIRLPRTEFLILSRLARTPERIVAAEELWGYAWGMNKPLNLESLHVYIYRLRNKLTPHPLHIDTMVNVGYRLVLE